MSDPGFDHGGASITDAWEEQAEGWIRWARTPGVDDYYELYNLPNFLELLPPPSPMWNGSARLATTLAEAPGTLRPVGRAPRREVSARGRRPRGPRPTGPTRC